LQEKNPNSALKTNLHPRNLHRERYDFQVLIKTYPALAPFVKRNEFGNDAIDFFNPEAVKALNQALLNHFYGIENWDIPANYLCPPIPGRVDYLHYLADILGNQKTEVRCLDIGVGANCIYPILGISTYNWSFVGSDIDPIALENAKRIADMNPSLKGKLALRLQTEKQSIFHGIIQKDEKFHLTSCNPPFHESAAAALTGSKRKINNLKKQNSAKIILNFGGQSNELWCDGGELKFVEQLILESKEYANSCLWFSSLISKKEHLKHLYKILKKVNAREVKTIEMSQGNKTSHLLAWTFVGMEGVI
jgi:23S rRNA (adenine1618-N6)-methyltransferase